MATRPTSPRLPAARTSRPSTRGFSSTRKTTRAKPPSRFNRLRASASRPSADLAGRSVALSDDIPTLFDHPLGPHHKLIGGWVAARETSPKQYTRAQARRRIEQVFGAAVLEILAPVDLADFRMTVLKGEDGDPPAIAIVCDSMGQMDLGWIETSDAPISWRAAAYHALEQSLGCVLPVFGYQDLFDQIAMYYWDGETEDEGARQSLIYYHGADEADLEEQALPSTMNARRPDWMITANAAPPAQLPTGLQQKLRSLHHARRALKRLQPERNAWHFDIDLIYQYVPGFEECSSLPPLTLVPTEQFAPELDDVGRHGMEMGFMDIAGLCPLPEAGRIDDWLTSLRLGAQFLLAAQHLIQLDPTNL
ncbi:hypothetical protein [Sphingobium indicum]